MPDPASRRRPCPFRPDAPRRRRRPDRVGTATSTTSGSRSPKTAPSRCAASARGETRRAASRGSSTAAARSAAAAASDCTSGDSTHGGGLQRVASTALAGLHLCHPWRGSTCAYAHRHGQGEGKQRPRSKVGLALDPATTCMALRSPPPLPPLPPPLPRSDSLGSISSSSSSSYRDEGSFTTAAEGGSLSRRGSEMGSPGLDGQDDDTDATLSAAVRGYRAASPRDALTSRASWAGPSSAAAVVGGVSRPDRSQRALDSANDAYLDAYDPPSPRHGSVPTIEKSSPTRNPDSSSRLDSSSTQMQAQGGTSRLSVGSSLEGRDRSPSPSLRRSDNSLRHDLSTSPTSTARGSPVISGQWSPNLGMGSARARRAGELSEKSQRVCSSSRVLLHSGW